MGDQETEEKPPEGGDEAAPAPEEPAAPAPAAEEPAPAESAQETSPETAPVATEEPQSSDATSPQEPETQQSTEAQPSASAEKVAPTDEENVEKKPSATGSQEPTAVKSKTSDVKASRSRSKSKLDLKKESSVRIDAKTSSQVIGARRSGDLKKVASSVESLGHKRSSSKSVGDHEHVKGRLTSKAQKAVGSIISIRRLSAAGDLYDKTKGARYMNTYKLDADRPFNPEKVQKILETVMEEALANLTYDSDNCPKQAKWASSAIRARVKELDFDRYKLVCVVTIGEKTSQDVLVACRFLWDADRDRYAHYSIENTFVFGIAQCFGLYYE